jgi:sigma-B regulation protein RsbU (phosphoserine phosphatase)
VHRLTTPIARLDPPPPQPASSIAHVQSLLAQVDAMQAELDNLRELADARRYHMEQVERELKLAARLQRDFLPKKLPNHGRVKFNRLYRPAGHVSGDLYDVRRLDEQHVGVYLADAIGHGMPAALLAMFMHNALQTKRIGLNGGYELLSSHEAMRLLNETLCGQELAHTTFATAVYSRVNLETGQIDFSRGGHPLPMLIRAGGAIEEIGGEGALLGVMPEERFEPLSLTLAPGDRLIFFTDGVETLFVPPGEPADMDCWRAAMRERRQLPADELLADLWQHFEKRGAVDDDVTVVTMEMT